MQKKYELRKVPFPDLAGKIVFCVRTKTHLAMLFFGSYPS